MRIHHTTYRKIIAALILLSCVSSLFAQGSKTYRVTAEATDGGDGSSWTQATTLENALSLAKAGDEIWVKGYEDITGHIYKAPKGGFVLPSVPCRCMEVLQEKKPSRTISLRADTNIR